VAKNSFVNPVVEAIISGKAPQPARLAAARGMLPLQQSDLLEVLVALTASDDAQISSAATETLKSESPEDLLLAAKAEDTAPNVLAYLATQPDGTSEVYEATVLNARTPDQALAKLAATTSHSSLLELITINQQRLVRCPEKIQRAVVKLNDEPAKRARSFSKRSAAHDRLPTNFERAGKRRRPSFSKRQN
jgi:hypothetical protein